MRAERARERGAASFLLALRAAFRCPRTLRGQYALNVQPNNVRRTAFSTYNVRYSKKTKKNERQNLFTSRLHLSSSLTWCDRWMKECVHSYVSFLLLVFICVRLLLARCRRRRRFPPRARLSVNRRSTRNSPDIKELPANIICLSWLLVSSTIFSLLLFLHRLHCRQLLCRSVFVYGLGWNAPVEKNSFVKSEKSDEMVCLGKCLQPAQCWGRAGLRCAHVSCCFCFSFPVDPLCSYERLFSGDKYTWFWPRSR